MRAPISWLAEYVDVPADVAPRQLADALVRIGMEVESVESGGDQLHGPIVVGRVVSAEPEAQKNGKTINWCQVDVGEFNVDGEPRGIVCGAHNFGPGDLVVVSLPGAVLPGGFAIAARKTYGHVSDGMICSVRELGIGDDHEGILVLPAGSAEPGADPLPLLGLTDAVLDIAVTTDRGYTMSIRGLARETSAALDVPFRDVTLPLPAVDGNAYDVEIDPGACLRFSARAVTGLDPAAPSPDWMITRLRQCGIRSISLAVDVTNYVMLETGQPLHAFDRDTLSGPIRVRTANPGEKITTLDDAVRALDPADVLVTDDSGPIALAGVMGGASTEIGDATTSIVLEAATWIPDVVARTVRRHKLPSEAARRFERGVDPEIAGSALERCVALLVTHGGATAVEGYTVVGEVPPAKLITMHWQRAEQVAGMPIPRENVVAHLEAVGCTVDGGDVIQVQPPTWRPDLLVPADLIEEVVRLAGYDRLPSVLPSAPAGRGLTGRQQLRRAASRAAAASGYTEVLSYPFVSTATHDTFGLAPDDQRRNAARLVNPLSDDEPELRTSLLPGLLGVTARNLGRGTRDLAIFETGLVFLPRSSAAGTAGEPPVLPGIAVRPTDDEIAALDATLPDQPTYVAAVLTGNRVARGWWGAERPVDWADAVDFARVVAGAARVELTTHAVALAPWHPGRCAELRLGDVIVGYAGELHPRVVAALDLPERSCAVEISLDSLPVPAPPVAPQISAYPPVLLDVALVVADDVPAAAVETTIRETAGELLESVRLFSVYADAERVGAGLRSVTFALRFRAPDRTLTVDEATAARDVAVAAAVERHGARLR